MFTFPSLTLSGGYVPPPILKIEPGDVLIVQSPRRLNRQQIDVIGQGFKAIFPNHQIVVLPDGLHLTAARPSA
jgi:hypothetical protein